MPMTKSETIRTYHDVLTTYELADTCDCSMVYVRRVLRAMAGRRKPQPHLAVTDAGIVHERQKARARSRRKFGKEAVL
jgi:hypothetical protein